MLGKLQKKTYKHDQAPSVFLPPWRGRRTVRVVIFVQNWETVVRVFISFFHVLHLFGPQGPKNIAKISSKYFRIFHPEETCHDFAATSFEKVHNVSFRGESWTAISPCISVKFHFKNSRSGAPCGLKLAIEMGHCHLEDLCCNFFLTGTHAGYSLFETLLTVPVQRRS